MKTPQPTYAKSVAFAFVELGALSPVECHLAPCDTVLLSGARQPFRLSVIPPEYSIFLGFVSADDALLSISFSALCHLW